MHRSAKTFFLKTQTFFAGAARLLTVRYTVQSVRSGGIFAHIVPPLRTHELAALCRLKGADLRRWSPTHRVKRGSFTHCLSRTPWGGAGVNIKKRRWDRRSLWCWITFTCAPYLTCPLCDDSSGCILRMCAVLVNYYRRQLLAVSPQFNFSLLQGYSIQHELQQQPLRSG